jgi:hypothetical protein
MPTLKVAFNKTTKVARVLDASASVPGGFVDVGSFAHPDTTYPDSVEIYHGVRDLLYKRSAANPANTAKFPDNICAMQDIKIEFLGTPRLYFRTDLNPIVIALSGGKVRLEVEAVGGKAPLAYKWYRNNVEIAGQTSTILDLEKIDINRAGEYHAKVTDADGTAVLSKRTTVAVSTPVVLTGITASSTTVALSVAADLTNGKTVSFTPAPALANMGVLTIKTAPLAARATATITNNVLKVKPVAAGAATTVVVTNGAFDITINITVAA